MKEKNVLFFTLLFSLFSRFYFMCSSINFHANVADLLSFDTNNVDAVIVGYFSRRRRVQVHVIETIQTIEQERKIRIGQAALCWPCRSVSIQLNSSSHSTIIGNCKPIDAYRDLVQLVACKFKQRPSSFSYSYNEITCWAYEREREKESNKSFREINKKPTQSLNTKQCASRFQASAPQTQSGSQPVKQDL